MIFNCFGSLHGVLEVNSLSYHSLFALLWFLAVSRIEGVSIVQFEMALSISLLHYRIDYTGTINISIRSM